MLNTIYSKTFSGLNISSEPIDVIFNKQDYGIYLIEDFLDKYLIEENRQRESFIFEVVDDQIYFNRHLFSLIKVDSYFFFIIKAETISCTNYPVGILSLIRYKREFQLKYLRRSKIK